MILCYTFQYVDQICPQVLPRRLFGEETGGVFVQGRGGALVGVQGPPGRGVLAAQDTRRLQQTLLLQRPRVADARHAVPPALRPGQDP